MYVALILALLALGGALALLPPLLQWLRVQPNEISLERPYLEHNIEMTRRAFGLADVEEKTLPMTGALTHDLVERNEHLLSEVRLWDGRALERLDSALRALAPEEEGPAEGSGGGAPSPPSEPPNDLGSGARDAEDVDAAPVLSKRRDRRDEEDRRGRGREGDAPVSARPRSSS